MCGWADLYTNGVWGHCAFCAACTREACQLVIDARFSEGLLAADIYPAVDRFFVESELTRTSKAPLHNFDPHHLSMLPRQSKTALHKYCVNHYDYA